MARMVIGIFPRTLLVDQTWMADECELVLLSDKKSIPKSGSLSDNFEAGANVESKVSRSKGRGSPIPSPVRAHMEPRSICAGFTVKRLKFAVVEKGKPQ